VSKKGDARIARAVERKLREQQKSVRLVERIKTELPATKQPRVGANPDSIYQMQMDWDASEADREGNWSWGPRDWTEAAWDGVIHPKLANFKTMKWHEIEAAVTSNGHRMHHPMPIETICDECQTRLLKLEKVDGDIYRFRLGNLPRLWGFRVLHVFEILWYDPEHNVYPTDPD
jgi:hypothetical protein